MRIENPWTVDRLHELKTTCVNQRRQAAGNPLRATNAGMNMIPLPDAMSLLQAGGALCLIALIARRRAVRQQDWEGALGKLSGRVRDEELS